MYFKYDGRKQGRRIKAARRMRGLSQDELARILILDTWRIEAIERGAVPTPEIYEQLCAALGVPEAFIRTDGVDLMPWLKALRPAKSR